MQRLAPAGLPKGTVPGGTLMPAAKAARASLGSSRDMRRSAWVVTRGPHLQHIQQLSAPHVVAKAQISFYT